MKNRKNIISTILLTVLTTTLMVPFLSNLVQGQTSMHVEVLPYGPNERPGWLWIKTDTINILFPAEGKKPMFLWWFTNDESTVYVVKYKGLIEYLTIEYPYYRRIYEATQLRLRTILNETYITPQRHKLQTMTQMRIRQQLMQLTSLYSLHGHYLPFKAGQWNLTGPIEVTRGDVQYLSFNFTLTYVPLPGFKFAENNVIIRCRLYYTPAEENVEDLYTYNVDAGELKMDLIVQNWTWNIDLIQPFLEELSDYGIRVPAQKAGLALWTNLATIPIEHISLIEDEFQTNIDGRVEAASRTQNMYVEGAQINVIQNKTQLAHELEQPMRARARLQERYKLRYESTDTTPTGYFKYVPKALLRDGENLTVIDVAASYIPAGNHMRLYLCYPYFGNQTLEHDPSLGLEITPTLITTEALLILVSTAAIITVIVLTVRWKRNPLNIVGP